MSAVNANDVTVEYSVETSLGVPSTTWKLVEPNTIGRAGAELTTVARQPISPNRQRRKGEIVNLESGLELEFDFTLEALLDFLEGALYAKFNGPGNLSDGAPYRPTAATASGYTVAAGGALAEFTLVYARGWTIAANNGLKVVGAGSTATNIAVAGLVAETTAPAQNITVEVAGVQGASDDIVFTAGGHLTSTVLNFTTLGLTVGQWIKIGGSAAATRFATSAINGFARITAIAAGQLSLDRHSFTVAPDAGAGKTIHLYFGRFGRNVPTTDSDYVARSYQFEIGYPDLDAGTDAYEYLEGNFVNELALNLPLTDIGKITANFVGTDANPPTTSRATGASAPLQPVQTAAFNMASDFGRVQLNDAANTVISSCLKDMTITLRNNVSPENCLGTLGASRVNTGLFEVDVEFSAWYDDPDVAAAVRNNTTVVLDLLLKNEDGGVYVDVPAMTVGDGTREFPTNETVLIALAGQAFQDPVMGTSISFSIFPVIP